MSLAHKTRPWFRSLLRHHLLLDSFPVLMLPLNPFPSFAICRTAIHFLIHDSLSTPDIRQHTRPYHVYIPEHLFPATVMKCARSLAALLLSILGLSPYTLAANVVRVTLSKRDLGFDVPARDLSTHVLPRATISENLFNDQTYEPIYVAEVKVGSPGQPISLIIDTGSSDTFVLANNDDQCNDPQIMYNYGPCFGGTCAPCLEFLLDWLVSTNTSYS